jgi:hypothetical protein
MAKGFLGVIAQRRITEMHRFTVFLATFTILAFMAFFKLENDFAFALCVMFLSGYSAAFWGLGLPRTVI